MVEKKLRIELLVASPPTKKCKELISMFESFINQIPNLRMDVYYAGASPSIKTTSGFQKNVDKRVKIPTAFVNGKQIDKDQLFIREENLKKIQEELKKGFEQWDE